MWESVFLLAPNLITLHWNPHWTCRCFIEGWNQLWKRIFNLVNGIGGRAHLQFPIFSFKFAIQIWDGTFAFIWLHVSTLWFCCKDFERYNLHQIINSSCWSRHSHDYFLSHWCPTPLLYLCYGPSCNSDVSPSHDLEPLVSQIVSSRISEFFWSWSSFIL